VSVEDGAGNTVGSRFSVIHASLSPLGLAPLTVLLSKTSQFGERLFIPSMVGFSACSHSIQFRLEALHGSRLGIREVIRTILVNIWSEGFLVLFRHTLVVIVHLLEFPLFVIGIVFILVVVVIVITAGEGIRPPIQL
jgi:hypothetical protein